MNLKIGIYVEGYRVLSFAKNIGKNLSNKYSQKVLDSAKKSTTDAIKTTSKRTIQKTAEATDDLIGNKIDHKITKASNTAKAKSIELNKETPKEVYICHLKKGSKLLMN